MIDSRYPVLAAQYFMPLLPSGIGLPHPLQDSSRPIILFVESIQRLDTIRPGERRCSLRWRMEPIIKEPRTKIYK